MDKSSTTVTMNAAHIQQHYVLVSSPGMGHLIPFLELAKRISQTHNIKSTILLVSTRLFNSEQQSRPLTSLISKYVHNNPLIDLIEILAVDISSLIDPDADLVWKIVMLMRETRPAIRAAIQGLNLTSLKPTSVLLDLFATESINIARELALPVYFFCTSSSWFLALTAAIPLLDSKVKGEYVNQPFPLMIPGCNPIKPADVVGPMLDRSLPEYREYLRIGTEIPLFDGLVVNTWRDLEHSSLTSLTENETMKEIIKKQPVFAIGPLTKEADLTNDHDDEKLIKWINGQPNHSVLFVSFGSGGTLSTEQMTELAWGLELSQQRFIWVIRPPIDNGDSAASYFGQKGGEASHELDRFLPSGFITRTKDRGILIKQWGPQGAILNHRATGGFLSHTGWNSTLDGLTSGVPIITWPLFAEQRMNSAMLVDEHRVAIRTKENPAVNVVGREEIRKMIIRVMVDEEGVLMRNKSKNLQLSAKMALTEGGTSYADLARFVECVACKQ